MIRIIVGVSSPLGSLFYELMIIPVVTGLVTERGQEYKVKNSTSRKFEPRGKLKKVGGK